ncbi:hypothetical protein [Hymenobacter terricola]|uniref:hypothetical protein n=1 Tax=Hymenobacter terricola TaxID=2819236 RepID=UPI001B303191|nr:hypothetical protein [Hymenobacter terricola]
MIITSISDFSLQYDEPLGLLRVEWASGDDMRTFRTSATELLQLSQQLGVRHLLLNMNTLPDISVYDQVWLSTDWMAAVVNSPLERVVLVNHRRRVHNQLAIESLIAQARRSIRFDIQYFPQPGPGLHWLSDYSDRLPALLAEWAALHGPAIPPASAPATPRPLYRPHDS